MVSFETIHIMNQRATPSQIAVYKHALLLHKIYNDKSSNINWIDLFFTQHFNQRNQIVKFFNTAAYKVGNNLLTNRFTILNGKIELPWLNDSFSSYEIKCESKFCKLKVTSGKWVVKGCKH